MHIYDNTSVVYTYYFTGSPVWQGGYKIDGEDTQCELPYTKANKGVLLNTFEKHHIHKIHH